METLENNLVTFASPEDLKVIEVIICEFRLYDAYYGHFAKYKLGLNYNEYSTLRDDFKYFYQQATINLGKFSIKELNSLKKSLILIRNENKSITTPAHVQFLNFLDDAILNLDTWVESIIDEIVSSVE